MDTAVYDEVLLSGRGPSTHIHDVTAVSKVVVAYDEEHISGRGPSIYICDVTAVNM